MPIFFRYDGSRIATTQDLVDNTIAIVDRIAVDIYDPGRRARNQFRCSGR
jgi:hypothetical protein